MSGKYSGFGLLKKYKTFLFRSAKVLIILEVGGLLVSYTFWRRINTDQDFRLYMYKNHNWLLEGYYSSGEVLSGDKKIREFDQETWRVNGSI